MRPIDPVSIEEIRLAGERIRGTVVRTPLIRLGIEDSSAEIYLKLALNSELPILSAYTQLARLHRATRRVSQAEETLARARRDFGVLHLFPTARGR